jgi:crotonobetainyl-CoA:carnitine CoA-transferase CaiB-like acyl-CoA transferase
MGREDLISDPRCADDLSRGNNYELINEVMQFWCATRTTAAALEQLERARIPCGPVYQLSDVFNDPQVQARELFRQLDYPGSPAPIPIADTAIRFSHSAGEVRHRAPTLGEHTDKVLRQLGFSSEEIAEFHAASVI